MLHVIYQELYLQCMKSYPNKRMVHFTCWIHLKSELIIEGKDHSLCCCKLHLHIYTMGDCMIFQPSSLLRFKILFYHLKIVLDFPTRLFKSFKFGNGSRMSNENLVMYLNLYISRTKNGRNKLQKVLE